MNSKRLLSYLLLVFGSLIAVVGISFVAMYIFEAIVARLGEPDQSLLFWYLPILFLGLAGMAIGIAMGAWGIRRLRKVIE